MANINTTVITPGRDALFIEKMLRRGKPYMVQDQFGTKVPFKKRNGTQIRFRRYETMALATTPVTEGVTPAEGTVSITNINATLRQYLNWLELTDVVVDTSIEDVKKENADVLGENKGRTMNMIYRDLLLGGTSIYYANAVAAEANVITHIANADLDAIDRALFVNEATYFAPMTKGDPNFGTSPILPAYWVVCHNDVKKDLPSLTGYTSVERYAGQTSTKAGEMGACGNFRFVPDHYARIDLNAGAAVAASGLKTTGGTNVDVYVCQIFGQDAYAVCPLEALNVDLITHDFGSSGVEDPGNQLMSLAWKAMTTLAITNDNWMYQYYVGVTA